MWRSLKQSPLHFVSACGETAAGSLDSLSLQSPRTALQGSFQNTKAPGDPAGGLLCFSAVMLRSGQDAQPLSRPLGQDPFPQYGGWAFAFAPIYPHCSRRLRASLLSRCACSRRAASLRLKQNPPSLGGGWAFAFAPLYPRCSRRLRASLLSRCACSRRAASLRLKQNPPSLCGGWAFAFAPFHPRCSRRLRASFKSSPRRPPSARHR